MQFRRYAIYHLPTGDLGSFGSSWLGWDVRTGRTLPHPDVANLPDEAETLTAIPMRYGFHATLKAPFRLAPGHSAEDLSRRAELVCDHLAPFDLELELRQDWDFVALRPVRQPVGLIALEQALVTRLDDLRATLTPDEHRRRHPESLPDKARQHLDHWGYPFVLDLFNYHLTLSNGLTKAQAQELATALQPVFAPLIAQPIPVTSVALVGEDETGRFHLIRDIALRAPA